MERMKTRKKHLQGIQNLLKDQSSHDIKIRTNEERVQHLEALQCVEENLFAVQYTTVHKAAFDGCLPGLKYFQKKFKSGHLNLKDKSGFTPIHYSAERGHSEAVEFLVSNGVEVNTLSTSGLTPLMSACRSGQCGTIRTLIRLGAHLMSMDGGGNTAAHLAAAGDFPEALTCLLEGAQERRLAYQNSKAMIAYKLTDSRNEKSISKIVQVDDKSSPTMQRNGITPDTPILINTKNSELGMISDSPPLQSESVSPTKEEPPPSRLQMLKGKSWSTSIRASASSLANTVKLASKSALTRLPSSHSLLPLIHISSGKGMPLSRSQTDLAADSSKLSPTKAVPESDSIGNISKLTVSTHDSHLRSPSLRHRKKHVDRQRSTQMPDEVPADLAVALETKIPESPIIVIDTSSSNGFRPLHVAANSNAYSAVEYLVSAGVNLHALDGSDETALHKAARRNFYNIYRMLKAAGCRDDQKNILWESPAKLLVDENYL